MLNRIKCVLASWEDAGVGYAAVQPPLHKLTSAVKLYRYL